MNAITPAIRSARHQAARKKAERGVPVFPCQPGSKEPATPHGFRDASCDLAAIDQRWKEADYNVAFEPERAGLCVLDIDGAEGENTLAELELKHGCLPETYEVRTPRGGRHLYFRGSLPPSTSKLGPKLDTRGRGSYVLIPPSSVNGRSYEILRHIEPAELPAWIPELLEQSAQAVMEAAVDELDLPANVARAEARLRQLVERGDVAIEGQGGDDRTYRLAAEMLELGLSPERTLDLVDEIWNPHCRPQWSRDELSVKIENASHYAQNTAGAFAVETAQEAFGAALDKLKLAERASGAVRFRDVLTRTVAPVQELIAGLLEKGTVTFLAGPGGTHKSRVAVQWGLSIEAGKPIFGRTVTHAHFVYLSFEDHPDELARRAQAIARRVELSAENNAEYWDLSGRDAPLAIVPEDGEIKTTAQWDKLRTHLLATRGHKFLVIDSTYNALRFVGSAKINEGAVMAAIGLLQRLCDECDCTILILWHPSQAGQERGDASGWSVAWHNAPRARLSITAVKDTEDAFELKVEKRNHGPKGKPITLHWSDGALLPRTETNTTEQEAVFQRAVVRVAIASAEQGVPIQTKGNLLKWQLDEIEREIGRRPTQRETKETLASALPRGLLRYLKPTRHRSAGYYPPDEETAAALARAAKRHAVDEPSP